MWIYVLWYNEIEFNINNHKKYFWYYYLFKYLEKLIVILMK